MVPSRKRRAARGEDVVVDDGDVGLGIGVPFPTTRLPWLAVAIARAGKRLRAAPRQPALDLAHPVELQAGRADDDRRVGVVGLERRQRLDRLAKPLLVGQEGAPLLQQVGNAGALERLQLATETRQHADAAASSAASVAAESATSPAARACLLADLLQDHKRLGLDPDVALGQEAVEFLDAERIGADRRQLAVVAPARERRACSGDRSVWRGAAQPAERVELRGVVAGSEHERGIVVDGGQLQHSGRRRAPFLERGHTAASSGACEAAHVLLDGLPRLERQGNRHAAGRAERTFAQLGRQADGIAKQKEHGLIGLAGDVDRSAPGGRASQPPLHARIDAGQLELLEQLHDQMRVMLDGRQRESPLGPLERAQVAARGKRAGERSVIGRDQHPVLLAPVALELHVVAHRAGPGGRPLGDLGQRVGGVFAEAQTPGLGGQRVNESGSLLVQRDQRASDRRQLVRVACSSKASTIPGARSVANVSHQLSFGRATSSTHSSWLRRPR